MIELLEDRVAVHLKGSKVFTVNFSEIESIRFFDHFQKSQRAFKYKLLDPFYRIADYSQLTVILWFNEVVLGILPPFFFGFGSKKGEIIIERKKGWKKLRLIMPWLNTMKKTRVFSLTPSDPNEYFQQLQVAYAKWERLESTGST